MLLFFLPLLAFKFHLKSTKGDLYVGKKGSEVTFVDPSEADIYELEKTGHTNQDYIMVRSKDNAVWDISGGQTKLIYWNNKHGAANQRFTLVEREKGHVKIVNLDKYCISWNPSANHFEKKGCTEDDDEQAFDFVSVNTEMNQNEGVLVDKIKLDALKKAAMTCPEIREMLGAEFIAEIGVPGDTTKTPAGLAGALF